MFSPRSYQQKIIDFIKKTPKCLIFCGCGMGKTAATLQAALDLGLKRVLVIAPRSVCINGWPFEVQKWQFPVNLRNFAGKTAKQRDKLASAIIDCGIMTIDLINYESINFIMKQNWPYDLIIADECTKLKHYRPRSGCKAARNVMSIAKQTPRFIGLTGTPTPNGLIDLWGQYAFIGDGLGRSFTAFTERYFSKFTFPNNPFACKYTPLPFAEQRIGEVIAGNTINIKAEEYFNLQKPQFYRVPVQLSPKNQKDYEKLLKNSFTDDIIPANAAAKLGKLLQLANNFFYTDLDGPPIPRYYEQTKIDALKAVIDDLNGENAIVCYHYQADIQALKAAFADDVKSGAAVVYSEKIQTAATDWNDGKVKLLFINPAQAAHGLSLQHGGRNLIFYSVDWNLEQYLQVIERIGPMRQFQSGFRRVVNIYQLIAANTIEEQVYNVLEKKQSSQNNLLELLAICQKQARGAK